MSDAPVTAPQPGVDVDTGHDYDGIREFDNRLPNWWLVTLFGSIVFGVGYWMYFETLARPGLVATWREEDAEATRKAAASSPVSDELIVKLSRDPAVVEPGRALFASTCASCHGEGGEGKIGPNLTDGSWLHGGKPTDIYHTISKGVTSKGMPSWEPALGRDKVRSLAAYLETLRGRNLPGRAPEGQPL
jgi:cytochrome c oxidase cbb3-type subunit 3